MQRNILKVEKKELKEDNDKIIRYIKWYYILKKELRERFSIDVDEDFEKFAKLFNDFRIIDFNLPKIMEKYITAISIKDKIKEETQKLEMLQKQNAQLNNSIFCLQNKIDHYNKLWIFITIFNTWDLIIKGLNSYAIQCWK